MAECPHGDSDHLSEAELEGQEHVGYSASLHQSGIGLRIQFRICFSRQPEAVR